MKIIKPLGCVLMIVGIIGTVIGGITLIIGSILHIHRVHKEKSMPGQTDTDNTDVV